MGINVTSDEKGNYYLDQKKLIESALKAAKVRWMLDCLTDGDLDSDYFEEDYSDSEDGNLGAQKGYLLGNRFGYRWRHIGFLLGYYLDTTWIFMDSKSVLPNRYSQIGIHKSVLPKQNRTQPAI